MPVFGVPEVNEHITSRIENDLSRGLSRGMQEMEAVNEHIVSRIQNDLSRGLSRGMQQMEAEIEHIASRIQTDLSRGLSRGMQEMEAENEHIASRIQTDLSRDLSQGMQEMEARMHILGALEEFSGMGTTGGILHADRDFNEDDYEMLLALDHGGASSHQINGLPLSTAQSDFEEACAVCLDTPTAGDTIRHLPCLHKFHKDCIDPWLRRRTSCPVCKSSIT